MTILLITRKATRRLASALGKLLRPGDLVFLEGPLGAGKTFFTRCLLRSMGVQGRITSPTFALVQQYALGATPVLHCDLYRLPAGSPIDDLGLEETRRAGGMVIAEWAERFAPELGGEGLLLRIDLSEGRRSVSVTGEGRGAELAMALIDAIRDESPQPFATRTKSNK